MVETVGTPVDQGIITDGDDTKITRPEDSPVGEVNLAEPDRIQSAEDSDTLEPVFPRMKTSGEPDAYRRRRSS